MWLPPAADTAGPAVGEQHVVPTCAPAHPSGPGRRAHSRRIAQTDLVRTVGVEEELLLVERGTGQPLSVASRVLESWPDPQAPGDGGGPEGELQRHQVETGTRPHEDLSALAEELRHWRRETTKAAMREGAAVVALGTSPLPVRGAISPDERYQRIGAQFGLVAEQHHTCGCHVHVAVGSLEEAVGVLDRVRVWLAPLLALGSNSVFWQGQDTSYASFRYQMQLRWPSAGPLEVLGSGQAYQDLLEKAIGTGVLKDAGMAYFDVRPSRDHPTVEIRVADACRDLRDTVLLAALSRALVETAAREWAEGTPPPPVPGVMLRLAGWQASRYGLGESLLDPVTLAPRPAERVLRELVAHVAPALEQAGDSELVQEGLARVLAEGTGADHQRAVWERTGDLRDVVADAARATADLVRPAG